VVNFLVPAAIMHFAIPDVVPQAVGEKVAMRRGARRIMLLFLLTIVTAVSFHNFLHLPPVLGMMTGLAYLKFFAYFLKKTGEKTMLRDEPMEDAMPFDIYRKLARSEWDTLMFFYGVVLCVGGLGFIGYLALISEFIYVDLGATTANILIGLLSAVIDNIPVMFAVLSMMPDMSQGQWLLVTLTAGVGGSMLSIGSAAGVALMGQSKGMYTFASHLKWTWAVALGYAASILTHIFINASIF
jgi:Na+/H+ antiporter NhaD/arsenite permease-like protein